MKCIIKETKIQKKLAEQYHTSFLLMNRWVELKQKNKDFTLFFSKRGYDKIAIYGMGHIGQRLYQELQHTPVKVLYGIDQNAEEIYAEIPVFTIQNQLDKVDAIIITPVHSFQMIKSELENKVVCPILSLEDVLREIESS